MKAIKPVSDKELHNLVRDALVAAFLKALPGQVRKRMRAIRGALKNNG